MIGQRSVRITETAASIKNGVTQAQRLHADELTAYRSESAASTDPTHADDFESLLSALENEASSSAEAQSSLSDEAGTSSLHQSSEDALNACNENSESAPLEDMSGESHELSLDENPTSDRLEEIDHDNGLNQTSEGSQTSDLSGAGFQLFEHNTQASTPSAADMPASVSNTIPVSETAAKIAEELQKRARFAQEQRWQFSLPGLIKGELTVTVEKLADHSWLVQLETNDECGDEELLALQHRLNERLGQVSVSAQTI